MRQRIRREPGKKKCNIFPFVTCLNINNHPVQFS